MINNERRKAVSNWNGEKDSALALEISHLVRKDHSNVFFKLKRYRDA